MSTGQTLPLQKPPGYRDPIIHPSPPPKSAAVNLPPSFHPEKKTRCRKCRSFCCCLCITLATLLVLILLGGGLFYLIFQPRLPVINIKSLKFTKSNITVTPQGPTLDAESSIERTQVSLNAVNGGPNLGESSVPGFVQEKGGVRILKFVSKADNVVVDEKTAGELGSKNLGVINVGVRSGVGLQGNGWSSGTVGVKVYCEGVTQASSVAPPKCRIQILNIAYRLEIIP
ncbi:hypothetical protein ACJIZ3_018527 [Penstemon smallii]|uniref:Late embryogenesis abundant protein LEA-2 subgroup domain-containing protein n=1 Tax=Penstemon smallii TaxID=265156 RepID=A0ABD3SZ41_9LAMI